MATAARTSWSHGGRKLDLVTADSGDDRVTVLSFR
jgi:hypothetical protein